ncbi:GTP-binding protein [Dysosmobacter sp.]|uniref:TIGR03943 family putative permease subunit n=1 Tax=Dysosmobacter sp. TaxID=2591382 RepID=UPI0026165ED3|nr:GTP-binding protein [Dysosmobacter sp.]
MADIPVYLIAGFLDAGKTNFINGILEDGFARQDRTLLLCCEEGEEEYNPKALDNVTVITIEDEEELKYSYLKELEKKYRPQQVLIEYNGMWQMERLYREVLPANWVLYQIMTMVEASTFDLYAKNMGQLMMEKITNADMLVFNRCTPELRDSLRKRNLRMVNRRADIFLENMDGSSEDYLTGDECPFDLSQDVIDIPDDDFGVWYVDVMDHPDRYDGKLVHMKLIMCHSKKYPGIHCPGRFAMVCCENDIQFLGLIAKGDTLDQYENRDWIEVTARMSAEKHKAYKGVGPVMNVLSVAPCEKPAQEVVTF